MDVAEIALVAFLACLDGWRASAEIREALGPPLSDGPGHGWASSGER